MRVKATVVTYIVDRGYGWALPDNGRVTAFAHVNDVSGKLHLRAGDRIECEIISTPKGLKAMDIVILEDATAAAGGAL
jgi:cold shock CspA family protein